MRLSALVVLISACAMASGGLVAQPKPRFASTNLCADHYLLALAKPEDIAAISPLAADPSVSPYTEKALLFKHLPADIETLLTLRPDLVVSSVYTRSSVHAAFDRYHLKWVAVQDPSEISQIPHEIRRLGELFDQKVEAGIIADAFERELSQTAGLFASRHLSALVYERGGYMQQSEGLVGSILRHLGVRSAQTARDMPVFSALSIEDILHFNPDFLVLQDVPYLTDQGSLFDRHPALALRYPDRKRIKVPLPLVVCSGPAAIEALRTIVRQIDKSLNDKPEGPR